MRLIDADEIMQRLSYNNGTPTVEYYNNGDPVTFEMREIKGLIRNAPTVSPWVKTADRLPDKCDYYTMYLTTKKRNGGVWQVRGSFIKEHPELCPWWMPIPPLPEVTE